MTHEQMLAWLTLEGWQLYVWISAPTWRVSKCHPQHKDAIWHWAPGNVLKWSRGSASHAGDYHPHPWDGVPDEVAHSFYHRVLEGGRR